MPSNTTIPVHVWLVRAGERGIDEAAALNEGRAIIN